ncbi:MAG TPA: hypothetical protein VF712_02140 [Thermoleophilaceae bacterium]|jgi:hypothetical protein
MTDQSADQPAKRGDAAYRAQKDAIAARNDAVRKAGREFRQSEERKAAVRRAETERAESAGLRDTFGGNTAHSSRPGGDG